jgi:glutathione S-transferase
MSNPITHQLHVLRSLLSSTATNWRGSAALKGVKTPQHALELYDMEGCPFCRNVREVLTALQIDVNIYPCPKNGQRFRPSVIALGGKAQFPFLIDPNTGAHLYESEAIIDYLFKQYSGRSIPKAYQASRLKIPLSTFSSTLRGMRGVYAQTSKKLPEKTLHLWSFESSPYSRLVRERLCELEIPYHLHNLGKEQISDIGTPLLRLQLKGPYEPVAGGKRAAHYERTGHMQFPYVEDPNTGAKLLESALILDYLEQTYNR